MRYNQTIGRVVASLSFLRADAGVKPMLKRSRVSRPLPGPFSLMSAEPSANWISHLPSKQNYRGSSPRGSAIQHRPGPSRYSEPRRGQSTDRRDKKPRGGQGT